MDITNVPNWHLGDARLNTEPFSVSDTGDLLISDNGTTYTAQELMNGHGSPLEVFLPNVARARVRDIVNEFDSAILSSAYNGTFTYHYPMKVNQRKEFVSTILGAGAHIETSSHNELVLVRRLLDELEDPKSLRILSNGPKTKAYIEYIRTLHDAGFAITPIIEDENEMQALREHNGPVGIRVDLDLKVDSHWDHTHNRFGFPESALREHAPVPNLSTLSYHISSQIESLDGFTEPLTRAIALYATLKKSNPQLTTINVGGGAGIPYGVFPAYSTKELVQAIVTTCKEESARHNTPEPNLICEWGRYVAAPSQLSLFSVIGEKDLVDAPAKKWYIIDGSFIAHLPDTWSIQQRWHITPATRLLDKELEAVWFAGSSCDSDDEYRSGNGLMMPVLQKSTDKPLSIAVYDTGAYQDSLSSYHCLLSNPAQIMIDGDTVTILKPMETAEMIGKRFGWN